MKLAVIGVGLIGGSFALALKQAGAVAHVVGAGRDRANLEAALERGVIDAIASDPAAAARGADLVLLAAPVGQFALIFQSIASIIDANAVLTDAGSTKRDVIAAARQSLGRKIGQFVPAHPIAGGEKSGAAAASPELFRDKRVILTPLPENARHAVDAVHAAWTACGARISRMDPGEHDSVLAAVSHLPHLLAFALVHGVAGRSNAEQLFSYAASGFRDFTRIASSHPEMWRDICIANRDRLLDEVARFCGELDRVKGLLASGDAPGLEKLFAEAREARNKWIRSS